MSKSKKRWVTSKRSKEDGVGDLECDGRGDKRSRTDKDDLVEKEGGRGVS